MTKVKFTLHNENLHLIDVIENTNSADIFLMLDNDMTPATKLNLDREILNQAAYKQIVRSSLDVNHKLSFIVKDRNKQEIAKLKPACYEASETTILLKLEEMWLCSFLLKMIQ